jgi:Ca2+-binding EF-hand superfamily protein
MSRTKYNQEEDLNEIKEGFEMFDVENKGQIDPLELKETMEEMNLKEKNPFIYDIISSFCSDKNIKSKGGLSSDDFISYLQNEMIDAKGKKGIKTIFNVFSDSDNKIPMTTFYQTAREVGDEEGGAEMRDLVEKSKTGGKEIDFDEFYDIMSTKSPKEKYNSKKENDVEYEYSYKNKRNSKYNENNREEPKTEVVVEKTVIEKVNDEPIKESHYTLSKKYENEKKDDDGKVEVKTTKYTYQSTSQNREEENNEKPPSIETKRYHRRFRSSQTNNNVNNNSSNNVNPTSGRRFRRKA